MAKREGPSTSSPRATKKAAKGGSKVKIEHDEREVDPQGLDKLPQDVWRRILDNLDENDLFPLALSCRSFRQKQKELVARKRREQRVRFVSSWELSALKTNLRQKLEKGQPTSVEYLWFCNKEIAWTDFNARGKRRQPHNMKKYLSQLAGFHGQLPLLQELVKAATKLVALVSMAAARGGQLETLQWLRTLNGFPKLGKKKKGRKKSFVAFHMREPTAEELFSAACESGHLEMLKWLRSEGCPWDEGACSGAAEGGHLEVLKWLRSEDCPWDVGACEGAAKGGHLEVLKWLSSEGFPWDELTCWGRQGDTYRSAAGGGHLEVLKWLKSVGYPWDGCAWHDAAEGGHLEVLKWLEREGCPEDYAYLGAVKGGQLEVLKWLRSKDYPWDEDLFEVAQEFNHSVFQWAIDNFNPDPDQ